MTASTYRSRPNVAERLSELGIDLPDVVPPLAAYVPAVQVGSLVHQSDEDRTPVSITSRGFRDAQCSEFGVNEG